MSTLFADTGVARFRPRRYQIACLNGIFDQFRTVDSTLVVMATGLGKTVVFAEVADVWRHGRVLVLAHRDELIQQAARKLEQASGERVDIEKAESRADHGWGRRKIVVGSVQTLANEKRLRRFEPKEFGLIIIDEAHHATSRSYRAVIDHFRGGNPDLKVLGVTATPDRSDKVGLRNVFDSVAFKYDIRDGIDDGYLVPLNQKFVHVDELDLTQVKTVAGDLKESDLAQVMEVEANLHQVVTATIELAGDRKTLVFGVNVEHARLLGEVFDRYRPGSARLVHGGTERNLRRQTLAEFAKGRFQFLCNCGVFTEGFDEPTVSCIANARPTKSRSLYTQICGRGTRPLADLIDGIEDPADRVAAILGSAKPDCLILDFVGNSGKHKLISSLDVLAGDDVKEDVKELAEKTLKEAGGGDVREAIRAAEDEIRRLAREKKLRVKAGAAKVTTRNVDPFDVFEVGFVRNEFMAQKNPASEGQKRYLKALGVDGAEAEKLSKGDAGRMIDLLVKRREEGLCTFKQAALLRKFDFPTEATTFDQAKEWIDAVAANGWRKPA